MRSFWMRGRGNGNHPLASRVLIPFTASWPKTLVLTGTADSVVECRQRVVRGIQKAGGVAEIVEYADLPHTCWTFAHIFPQLDDGFSRLTAFIYK
ncbi:hypothetical protein C8R48DRAFT_683164 [Suillus tomentosus]|nr:hypothetical protein C8R48DRAFT_683164 [Suillus tomentosus]